MRGFADLEPALILIAGAALLGFLFGLVAERSQFCLVSSVRDARHRERTGKPASFIAAILTALVATQMLILFGVFDLKSSIYFPAAPSFVAVVIGGFIFGVGAVATRGCPGRLTILAATGNLRALVVIVVFAATAYATQRGVLAWPRLWLERATPTGVAAVALPDATGAPGVARSVIVALALAALAGIVLAARASIERVVAGVLIGLLVAGGWIVTGWLGADPFAETRPSSFSFTAPLGASLQYLMIATGARLDFGVTLMGFVLLGAGVGAALGGRSHWRGFENAAQMRRYLLGALAMGFGAVTALGCSTGQGITGLSTLSILSFAATASIVGGMLAGLRLFEGERVASQNAASSMAR